MDRIIEETFQEKIDLELIVIIISNSTDKSRGSKIRIRPVIIKGLMNFQASTYIEDKIFHKNYSKEELIKELPNWFKGLFRQVEIKRKKENVFILISKKGKVNINTRKTKENKDIIINKDHDRRKNYILEEGVPIPFLIDLGVMTADGKIKKAMFNKFRQINRFLEFIEDILPNLEKDKEVRILDFGCGKSYLTFAMYYYLKILKGYHINIIGLDLKEDVVKKCNRLKDEYGYSHMEFLQGDISEYEGENTIDMVVSLHACNEATDYAIYKAVKWNAKVIMAVPCCQHEFNKDIHSDVLDPILKYGIIKERIAALATDALRGDLLESKGYDADLLEFIDTAHTPKNILIRAIKKDGIKHDMKKTRACMEFLSVSPILEKLFAE